MNTQNLRKGFMYIVVLLIIIQCNTLTGVLLSNGVVILLASCCIVSLIITYGSLRLSPKSATFLFVFMFCSFLLITIGRFMDIIFVLSVVLFFICAYVLYEKKHFLHDFMKAYTNVLLVICTVSLFFFVFASCLRLIQSTGYYPYSVVHWGKVNYNDYFHIYNEGQHGDFGFYSGYRNTGIFLEAPMYTYCLVPALYFEVFFAKKIRIPVVIIYCLTLATTFSTTAYLCMLFLPVYLFYYSEKIKKSVKLFCSAFIFAGVIIVVIILYKQKVESANASIFIRTDDIMAGLKCFIHNPIFGTGYNNVAAIDAYRSLDILKELRGMGYKTISNTLSSGMLGVLSSGGVLLGIWYLIPPIAAIVHLVYRNRDRNAMFFIIIDTFLLFVSVVHTRSLCTMLTALNWFFLLHPSFKSRSDLHYILMRLIPFAGADFFMNHQTMPEKG